MFDRDRLLETMARALADLAGVDPDAIDENSSEVWWRGFLSDAQTALEVCEYIVRIDERMRTVNQMTTFAKAIIQAANDADRTRAHS